MAPGGAAVCGVLSSVQCVGLRCAVCGVQCAGLQCAVCWAAVCGVFSSSAMCSVLSSVLSRRWRGSVPTGLVVAVQRGLDPREPGQVAWLARAAWLAWSAVVGPIDILRWPPHTSRAPLKELPSLPPAAARCRQADVPSAGCGGLVRDWHRHLRH